MLCLAENVGVDDVHNVVSIRGGIFRIILNHIIFLDDVGIFISCLFHFCLQ